MGKRGITPAAAPAVLDRLGLEPTAWFELVEDFGALFHLVVGHSSVVGAARSLHRHSRFHTTPRLREPGTRGSDTRVGGTTRVGHAGRGHHAGRARVGDTARCWVVGS